MFGHNRKKIIKIGIVEDNLSFVKTLSDMIEVSIPVDYEYEIQTASNDNQYKNILNYLTICNLILLDYHLQSNEIDGKKIVEYLHQHDTKGKIVFLTEDISINRVTEAQLFGITFIPKQMFNENHLYNLIDRLELD